MIKKIFNSIKEFIVEEYKLLLFCFVLLILFFYPVNYYIVIGGGISDVGKRVEVDGGYGSNGSFNMSYVSELVGSLGPYLLSYVIPSWDRESADLYKYSTSENISDIEFRNKIDLENANGNAIYWAYKLANKEIEVVDSKIYVIAVTDQVKDKFKVGDILLSINDKTYNSTDWYQEYLNTLDKDENLKIKVLRDKKEIILDTKLYEYNGRFVMGIYLQTVNNYKTSPDVKIKFKSDESGPSAGLMTTLAIYNQLTKDDLTKSLKIAGTGTIEVDGTIGEIGGVRYKLIGASHGKADVFLVPSANYEEAIKVKEEKRLKIKIIEVKTIEDAITKLEALK